MNGQNVHPHPMITGSVHWVTTYTQALPLLYSKNRIKTVQKNHEYSGNPSKVIDDSMRLKKTPIAYPVW